MILGVKFVQHRTFVGLAIMDRDGFRHVESIYDMGSPEFRNRNSCEIRDWDIFDPFGEVVHACQDKFVFSGHSIF